MTENISAAAANARESHRQSTGQFGTQPLEEADIVLMPLSERLTNPIDVQFGDRGSGYPEIVDATVMNSVSIDRDYDGNLTATGSQVFRYSDWAPGDPEDEEGREAWGERNQAIIDAVIEERYAGTTVDSDGDEAQVRFEYDLGAGPVTKQDVIDKMSTGAAVDFYNESDDGTYGTENLSRIIRERVERSVVVENPYDRDAQDYIRTLRTSGMVHEAPLLGRVSDNRAQAVAAEAAYNGDYPELRQFSTRGWGDREKLGEELDDAHAAGNVEDGAYQSLQVWLQKQERQG